MAQKIPKQKYKPPFYSAASYYWKAGMNVIPLIPRGKRPSTKWAKYATTRQTVEQLTYLRQYYGGHNIGIVTGQVSGVVVVDIDGPEGEECLKEYVMPPTLCVSTRRGRHMYYRAPSTMKIPNMASILPKVDIRGDGGYVVAPPSLAEDKTEYRWSESPSKLSGIPMLPDWIVQRVQLRQDGLLPRGKKADAEYYKRKDWLSELVKGVSEGSRNEACARYSGYLIGKHLTEESCIKELLTWNSKNVPPLGDKEVMSTFYSIYHKNRIQAYSSTKPMEIKEAKIQIGKWLKYEDEDIIDVVLSAAVMYDREEGPIWIIIVGPPACGKTELIRSIRNYKDTVFMESITSRTLFSGTIGKKGIMERMVSPRMLMINKDFGSIMAKGSTERGMILQQLRGLFDEEYFDETGSAKAGIAWEGRINFISAATQDIESKAQQAAIADLGERFLYFKMRPESEEAIRAKAMRRMTGGTSSAPMRKAVTDAMLGVLKACESRSIESITIPHDISSWMVELCMVAVRLRTRVKRDGYRWDNIEFKPNPEGVMRMLKSIKGMLLGLSLVRNKTVTDLADYGVAARMVLDSVPTNRKTCLKVMHFSQKWMTIREMVDATGLTDHTIRITMDDLCVVGLAERKKEKGESRKQDSYIYEIRKAVSQSIVMSGMEGLL